MKPLLIATSAVLALGACGESEPVDPSGDIAMATPEYGSSSGLDDPVQPMPERTANNNREEAAVSTPALGSDRIMKGRWFARELDGAPAALFGPPEAEARFSIRCADGELIATRGISMRDGPASMALMAGGKVLTLDATAKGDPLPTVTGRFSANDDFAAILAQTRDPIAVRVEDGPALRMPASVALRDVVGGCRE